MSATNRSRRRFAAHALLPEQHAWPLHYSATDWKFAARKNARLFPLILFLLRYVAPIGILTLVLSSVL